MDTEQELKRDAHLQRYGHRCKKCKNPYMDEDLVNCQICGEAVCCDCVSELQSELIVCSDKCTLLLFKELKDRIAKLSGRSQITLG